MAVCSSSACRLCHHGPAGLLVRTCCLLPCYPRRSTYTFTMVITTICSKPFEKHEIAFPLYKCMLKKLLSHDSQCLMKKARLTVITSDPKMNNYFNTFPTILMVCSYVCSLFISNNGQLVSVSPSMSKWIWPNTSGIHADSLLNRYYIFFLFASKCLGIPVLIEPARYGLY